MIRKNTFRKIALSLPQTEETPFRGHPAFRVKDKLFATLYEDENRAVIKVTREEQRQMVKAQPGIYSMMPFSSDGFTNVDLKQVKAAEIRKLIDDAWRTVAPKRMVQRYDKKH